MAVDQIRRRLTELRQESFDTPQNRAVDAILDEWDSSGDDFVFPIVDGPPGTGKTTLGAVAAAEYLLQHRGGRVAYLCYTHFAADEAMKKLRGLGFSSQQMIRITANPDETDLQRGIVGWAGDIESLDRATRRRVENTPLLLCTLHGSRKAFRGHEDRARVRLVVDEFSQVSSSLWFATLARARGSKVYPTGYALLGDPYQLPVITSQPYLRPNIGLYIRGRKPYQPHELVRQHRMHKDICAAVNSLRDALYAPFHLETSEKVRDRDLEMFGYRWRKSNVSEKLREVLDPSHPFVIIDTHRAGTHSRTFPSQSLENEGEAKLAADIATSLHDSFIKANGEHLCPTILSPYTAQVGRIRQFLPRELREHCTTIFSSQGREYPCVIISFVWNDPRGFIGFLQEPQLRAQVYVGCSRAQAKLVVLYSRDCFVSKGHQDFDLLDRTDSAYRTDYS